MFQSLRSFLPLLLLVPLVLASCGDKAPPPETPPRPVVTTTLEKLAPNPPFKVTGVAEPYREAEVSFEVSGRITAILDMGRSVEVHTREKTREEIAKEIERRKATGESMEGWEPDPLVHSGDVIAQIDDTSYRQRLEAAQLRLKTAESGLKAQLLDLEEVAPATVARAKAQRDAARSQIASARATVDSAESNRNTALADLERNRKLLRDRQISPSEFDQYQNAYDTAVANVDKANAGLQAAEQQAAASEATVAEAEASLRLKAENVAQTRAQIAELQVVVEQAETDLQRCVLRAPFVGRITHVHASHGDFVAAGKPVLRLTLIDPIKVAATVSADRERQILPGSHVSVLPQGIEDFDERYAELFGTVFEKAAVADASTRTFRIDVMVRNARRRLTETGESDATKVRFRELLPVVERHHGEGGPLFVCRSCCVEEQADGTCTVYRIKGGRFGQRRPREFFLTRLHLERVRVRPLRGVDGEFMQVLNWSFRQVEPLEGFQLQHGHLLLNFQHLDPKVVEKPLWMERFEWAIRPGDLVPIVFGVEASPRGYWVPDDAIRAQNAARSIFAVEDGMARAIPVTVHEACGRLRRVEGEGLQPGLKIVVVGVHYVFDGAPVTVSEELDLEALVGCDR